MQLLCKTKITTITFIRTYVYDKDNLNPNYLKNDFQINFCFYELQYLKPFT